MITVAIASENSGYDAELYCMLASRISGQAVTRWDTTPPTSFTGWRHVWSQAPLYLGQAAKAGVRHAIVAIDNDGGARRRPPHEDGHDVETQAADRTDGCRTCLLLHRLRETWIGSDERRCIVVPVQTLETWLLALRGFDFGAPTPEQYYDRRALKRRFFGGGHLPDSERTRLARCELERPEALAVLRERPSFRWFEVQLHNWR